MKLAAVMSSVLAGGLLLGSTFVSADRDTPPPPGKVAKPPKPPKPPKAPKVSVQIDGLDEMLDEHIGTAIDALGSANVPPHVRDKITKRLDKVRKKLKARVADGKLDPEELERLGEEFGEEMEEFGEAMEEWGEQFGKQMEKRFGSFDVHVRGGHPKIDIDIDDDHDDLGSVDIDDEEDLDDAMQDLGKLKLAPAQRDQIKKLRADSDAKVAAAKQELDRASKQLEKQLENPSTSDADIARSIDAVTQQEAAIRKARILAWVNARRALDDGQRRQVEAAAKKSK